MTDLGTKLCCNGCERVVEGIAYRTACCHFFCPACCQTTGSCQCPVCNMNLNCHDRREIIVGLESPLTALDALFQAILHCSDWTSIIRTLKQYSLGVVQCQEFLNIQLALSTKRELFACSKIHSEAEDAKKQRDSLHETFCSFKAFADEQNNVLQSQVARLEKELAELGEAYKEKMRKCNAWERAYSALRDQVTGRDSNAHNSISTRNFDERASITNHPSSHAPQPIHDIPIPNGPIPMQMPPFQQDPQPQYFAQYGQPFGQQDMQDHAWRRRTEVTTTRQFFGFGDPVEASNTFKRRGGELAPQGNAAAGRPVIRKLNTEVMPKSRTIPKSLQEHFDNFNKQSKQQQEFAARGSFFDGN